LLLVGAGSKEEEIKKKVKENGIESKVIFTGYRKDTNKLLQAMDLFAFPSRYEGLGLSLIEAQATGIPCIATEGAIPEEVKINKNFKFVRLNTEEWLKEIECHNERIKECKNNFKEKGYLIEDVINELTAFYCQ